MCCDAIIDISVVLVVGLHGLIGLSSCLSGTIVFVFVCCPVLSTRQYLPVLVIFLRRLLLFALSSHGRCCF